MANRNLTPVSAAPVFAVLALAATIGYRFHGDIYFPLTLIFSFFTFLCLAPALRKTTPLQSTIAVLCIIFIILLLAYCALLFFVVTCITHIP